MCQLCFIVVCVHRDTNIDQKSLRKQHRINTCVNTFSYIVKKSAFFTCPRSLEHLFINKDNVSSLHKCTPISIHQPLGVCQCVCVCVCLCVYVCVCVVSLQSNQHLNAIILQVFHVNTQMYTQAHT